MRLHCIVRTFSLAYYNILHTLDLDCWNRKENVGNNERFMKLYETTMHRFFRLIITCWTHGLPKVSFKIWCGKNVEFFSSCVDSDKHFSNYFVMLSKCCGHMGLHQSEIFYLINKKGGHGFSSKARLE